ncbi:MAG: hypothetical protein ACOVN7_05005 [Rubrivivax sp.]|jgi:hypothetical protein
MNQAQFRRPALATRLISVAFAAVMSLAMLAGVDALATSEPDAGLLARAQVGVKA